MKTPQTLKPLVKALLSAAAMLLFLPGAAGQTYDTVTGPNGRLPGYYYSYWYDECPTYTDTSEYSLALTHGAFNITWHGTGSNPDNLWCFSECVAQPAAIVGIAVLSIDKALNPSVSEGWPVLNGPRKPEYVYVLNYDSVSQQVTVLGTARWDTCQRKIYKLPRHIDSARFRYRYTYISEVTLDTPIYVDTLFYMGGTEENDRLVNDSHFPSPPTFYTLIESTDIEIPNPQYGQRFPCPDRRNQTSGSFNIKSNMFYPRPDALGGVVCFGPFIPKIDFADVDVRPADSAMGTAGPSGKLSKHVRHRFYARPRVGYRFIRWDDGDTSNPRYVPIESDTSFVAYFASAEQYEVVCRTESPYGIVTGGGFYYEGDEVRVEAVATDPRYRFTRWGDGDTSNPRVLTVAGDTLFTAFFGPKPNYEGIPEADSGLFVLMPNPAGGAVTVSLTGGAAQCRECRLVFRDAAGRERFTLHSLSPRMTLGLSDLAPGLYFVTLVTPQTSLTRRLIVE